METLIASSGMIFFSQMKWFFDIVKATSVHANRSLAIWYMQQQPQLK
jgi:hypothetical protein